MTLQRPCASPGSHFSSHACSSPGCNIVFLSLIALATSIYCGCAGLTQQLPRRWAPGALDSSAVHTKIKGTWNVAVERRMHCLCVMYTEVLNQVENLATLLSFQERLRLWWMWSLVYQSTGANRRKEQRQGKIPIKQEDAGKLKQEEHELQQTPTSKYLLHQGRCRGCSFVAELSTEAQSHQQLKTTCHLCKSRANGNRDVQLESSCCPGGWGFQL